MTFVGAKPFGRSHKIRKEEKERRAPFRASANATCLGHKKHHGPQESHEKHCKLPVGNNLKTFVVLRTDQEVDVELFKSN